MLVKINYALELARAIVDLEMFKKDIIIDEFPNPRMCYCKSMILDSYLTACQLLYIRVTSRVIRYIDELHKNQDKNVDASILINNTIFNFESLKDWFKYYAYNHLFDNKYVSKKILILFKKLQELIDKAFFDYFENEYKSFINTLVNSENINEEIIYKSLKELYINMRNWFETSIFNIISSNVSCKNIRDDIFNLCNNDSINKSFCFKDDVDKLKSIENIYKNRYLKPYIDYGKCYPHEFLEKVNKEFIHLIVIPEMLIYNGSWFYNYFNLFKEYHKDPKSIDIIIDYKLIKPEEYKWDEHTLKRLNLLIEIFGKIYLINHNHIDKTAILDQVKDYLNIDVKPDYFDESLKKNKIKTD